jgi:glycosyltransferase involved in cell wall biosynthesis
MTEREPLKIGIFSESYEPVTNGVSVSVTTLVDALRRLDHEVFVFAPEYHGYHDRESGVTRFPSVQTGIARDYPLAIPFLPNLAQHVKDLNLDVIHTQTPFMLGWLGQKLGERLNIPVISTNHTQYAEYVHYFPFAPRATTRSFVIGMMKRYYNQCDGVVVPTRATEEILREYGVETRIFIIPSGVSIDTSRDEKAREAVRSEFGIPSDARVLLYVGRLAMEKNLDLVFQAFDKLSGVYDDIRLMVVGGGPYEAECRKMASESRTADRITITGFKARESLREYYSAGDLFLFPSTTDTQGIALCEALQAGLPCIAVRAGGSPEVITEGEDGLLTQDDADDFTSRIDSLLGNHEMLLKFSANATRNAARFTPAAMANRMLSAYAKVCGSLV